MSNYLTQVSQDAAKVQKLSERRKSGSRAEQKRSEALTDDNMKLKPSIRMAKCQRAESPSVHKL